MADHLFVLGYSGELSVKAKGTRNRFCERLVKNLAEGLRDAGIRFELERTWSRLYLRSPAQEAGEVAARIFGVRSVAPAERRAWATQDDLLRAGEEIFAPAVRGKTFAVRFRRGGGRRQLPFRSPEIERELGRRLEPHGARVDLGAPQVEARIELRRGDAYFTSRRLEGPGGLPIGTEGRAVALVSGGFDSLVAVWLLLRRGVRVDYVFCNLGGDPHRAGAFEAFKVVADRWSFGYRPRLHMIEFQGLVEEIRQRCPQSLWQVVLKRQMLRVADRVARMTRAVAIVTGEAVGQVSSQTLQNLAVISGATELPILRPLATANKERIVELARRIGTYEPSARTPEYCALDPRQPETHAKAEAVAKAEAGLDLERLEERCAERAVFDLRALTLVRSAGLEVDEVPSEAVVIDLRSRVAFRSWHYPGALHLDHVEALKAYRSLDAEKTYLFYCEVGWKSAQLAELMTDAGVRACHFRGGLRALMRHGKSQGDALRAAASPVLLD